MSNMSGVRAVLRIRTGCCGLSYVLFLRFYPFLPLPFLHFLLRCYGQRREKGFRRLEPRASRRKEEGGSWLGVEMANVCVILQLSRSQPVERCPECGSAYGMEYVGPPDDPHAHPREPPECKSSPPILISLSIFYSLFHPPALFPGASGSAILAKRIWKDGGLICACLGTLEGKYNIDAEPITFADFVKPEYRFK